MNSLIPLCCLEDGDAAEIAEIQIDLSESMRNRFQDLGLIKGTRLKRVLTSAAGDPAAYYIRGAVIAIRNEDSRYILVRRVSQSSEVERHEK